MAAIAAAAIVGIALFVRYKKKEAKKKAIASFQSNQTGGKAQTKNTPPSRNLAAGII